jgi:hypothetical protein
VDLTRDQYVETIKETALSMGKKLVMDWLVSKAAFMAWAFPNMIAGFFVSKVLEVAIRETEFGLFFLYIDLRTSAQGKDFAEAAIRNQLLQKTGTEQEKADAEADLIRKFRDFVKFTS